jgi:hypothetical protein
LPSATRRFCANETRDRWLELTNTKGGATQAYLAFTSRILLVKTVQVVPLAVLHAFERLSILAQG